MLLDYWIKTDCIKWSAVDYSSFVLTYNPSLNKLSAMKIYSADIDVLLVAYDHNKLICSRLKAMKKMIGKDECMNQFWRDYSKDLNKLSTTVEDNAVKALCTESSNSASPSRSVPSTSGSSSLSLSTDISCDENRGGSNTDATNVDDNDDEKVEHDEVFVRGLNLSVGTLIKQKALEIHEQYKNDVEQCPVDDRKIISNGLSSILDLSDESINSQYRYFSQEQWKEVHTRFSNLKMKPLPIDSLIKSTLTIISYFYSKDANVNRSLKYVKSILDNDLTVQQLFCFTIAKHFLKLIKDYRPMLARTPVLDYTESDYTYIIWLKLFKKMFPPGNGIIRIKSGESIFDVSTANKKELYPDCKYVKGFKIDIRFVVDVDGKEIDLAAAEVAKDDSKKKTISDQGKLTREGKDVVDNLVDILSNSDQKSRQTYLFQIASNTCIISTLDLACNGLYVATSQTHFVLPSKPDDFNNLDSPFEYLLAIKSNMESLGLELRSIISDGYMGTVESLGINQLPRTITECVNWTRPTYYSPPGKSRSTVPSFVFGGPPPSILNKLKEAYEADRGYKYEDDDHGFDEFGWKQLANGKYYNKFIKEVADSHPLMKKKINRQCLKVFY